MRAAMALILATMLVGFFGCGLLVNADYDSSVLAGPEAGSAPPGCVRRTTCPPDTCGPVSDGCGGTVDCGGCDSAAERCKAGRCICDGKLCLELGAACGTVDDGCGEPLFCGNCTTANSECIAGQCQCKPLGCEGRCGQQPNGCLDVIECPACSEGLHCGGGGPDRCGPDTCTPRTCTVDDGPKRCGRISDGCGVIIECGGCEGKQTCGGGGVANECGCIPKTCEQLGAECGVVADNGCGEPIDCGNPCIAPETCGGLGAAQPNTCGCSPKSCQEQGRVCGEATDTCGTPLGSCGVCGSGQVCSPNGTCGSSCVRATQEQACAGKCGSVPDECGGPAFDCGGCAGGANYSCGADNRCVCTNTPIATACAGVACGPVPKGCGGTYDCPNTCTQGRQCVGNGCVCPDAPACAPGQCSSTSNACGNTRQCEPCGGDQICQANGYCGCPSGTNQCGGQLFPLCCGGGTPICIQTSPNQGCCSSNGQQCELQ